MRALFAIPGDLATLTGGYGYDRRVLALLPSCGVEATHGQLPGSFPFPSEADIAATIVALRAAPHDAVLLVDGLAYCALLPDAIDTIQQKIVALVHHPLGFEAGLSQSQSQALLYSEFHALERASHIIVTSRDTLETLFNQFCVTPSRVTVAEPGTDAAARAAGNPGVPLLLSVGSIVPRKAFDVLIAALGALQHRPWRLRIIGSPDRAPETAAALRAQIAASGMANRIDLAGELSADELARAYASADIFVLPSLYEGYGMVLGEAMARGLPIICTTGGAAANTVPGDAGLKVPPGDCVELGKALALALEDRGLRKRLSDASWRAGEALPRWRDTAEIVANVIKSIAGGGR